MSINRLHLACSENDIRFLSNYIESGKKDYEVKKDINLFAKRINKKLKELELVI